MSVSLWEREERGENSKGRESEVSENTFWADLLSSRVLDLGLNPWSEGEGAAG